VDDDESSLDVPDKIEADIPANAAYIWKYSNVNALHAKKVGDFTFFFRVTRTASVFWYNNLSQSDSAHAQQARAAGLNHGEAGRQN
jgi:hypothetical protein